MYTRVYIPLYMYIGEYIYIYTHTETIWLFHGVFINVGIFHLTQLKARGHRIVSAFVFHISRVAFKESRSRFYFQFLGSAVNRMPLRFTVLGAIVTIFLHLQKEKGRF